MWVTYAAGFLTLAGFLGLWLRIVRKILKTIDHVENVLPILLDITKQFPLEEGQSLPERIDNIDHVIDLQSQVLASVLRSQENVNNRLESFHRMLQAQGYDRRKGL